MRQQVPEGLSTLLAMARDVERGQIALKTPRGEDTVAKSLGQAMASQVMPQVMPQAMAPAGMQGALANAGIAGQIQSDKMAQEQDALRQMAAQQAAAQRNAPPIDPAALGIATAPGAGTVQMAYGGIVGYNGEEEQGSAVMDPMGTGAGEILEAAGPSTGRNIAEVLLGKPAKPEWKLRLEAEQRAREDAAAAAAAAKAKESERPEVVQMPNPTDILKMLSSFGAKPTPIDLSASKSYREKAEKEFKDIDLTPATSEQVADQYRKDKAVTDALMRAEGLDPNYIAAAQEAEKLRTQGRVKEAQDIIDRVSKEQKSRKLIDFLLSAQGFQGEGLGQVFKTGALGAQAAKEARQGRIDQLRQAQLDYQDASAKEQFLMNKMRYETAMNRFDKARDTLQDLKKATNDKRAAGIRMYTAFAGDTTQEGIGIANIRSREAAANAGATSRLMAAMMKGGPKPLSIKDEKILSEMKADTFFSPLSASKPEFRQMVGRMPGGQQILNDIAEGRIKFENGVWVGPGKKPVDAINRAADLYESSLRGRVAGSGGAAPTPYTQAESDLD